MFAKKLTLTLTTGLVAAVVAGQLAWRAAPARADDDSYQRETMIDQRFPVGPGGALEVSVGDADVELITGDYADVRVEVILGGRRLDDEAREYFQRQNFSVTQSGDTVRVETERRRQNWSFNWNDGWRRPDFTVRVHAPEQFDANLRTSDGDLDVAVLRGDLRAHTSDGDVTLTSVTGTTISLHTSDGDVRAQTLEASNIELRTSDGDLTFEALVADSLSARTSDGDVTVESISGDANLRTSDGDIGVGAAAGDTFYARTSDGSIEVETLSARSSTVTTSDGRITIDRLEGALSASSSDGDIRLGLPQGMPANLRLRGNRVSLDGSFTLDGAIERNRVEGSINGGGPSISARASDGAVTLGSE